MFGKRQYVFYYGFRLMILSLLRLLPLSTASQYDNGPLYPVFEPWGLSLINKGNPVITQLTAPVVHGEGPHWDSTKNVLYFVDIAGKKICQYDPYSAQLTTAAFDEEVGAVFPIRNTRNKFLVGVGTTLTEVTWNGENTTEPCVKKLYTVDTDKKGNRFNDGKVDSVGRLWIGTMGEEKPIGNVKLFQGSLYRLSTESCRLEPIVRNVSVSNGIVWSFDDKYMFFIDTPTMQVVRYDYNILDGSIENRKVLIDFKKEKIEGLPDGMTIDNNDNLWIACWNGSQVVKVNSHTGKLLARIKMPVPRVTSATFDDSFQILYVTTSMLGLSPAELRKYPSSGALFAISNLNVIGHPNNAASGCNEPGAGDYFF